MGIKVTNDGTIKYHMGLIRGLSMKLDSLEAPEGVVSEWGLGRSPCVKRNTHFYKKSA